MNELTPAESGAQRLMQRNEVAVGYSAKATAGIHQNTTVQCFYARLDGIKSRYIPLHVQSRSVVAVEVLNTNRVIGRSDQSDLGTSKSIPSTPSSCWTLLCRLTLLTTHSHPPWPPLSALRCSDKPSPPPPSAPWPARSPPSARKGHSSSPHSPSSEPPSRPPPAARSCLHSRRRSRARSMMRRLSMIRSPAMVATIGPLRGRHEDRFWRGEENDDSRSMIC